MQKTSLILAVEAEVKSLFKADGTGHDWYHIARVRDMALKIGESEGANSEITELAALLHDIADHKFHNNNLEVGPNRALHLILEKGGTRQVANSVSQIVAEVSFKGAGVDTPVSSIEAAVVQDADRLDAIGAIGIARAFAYGGHKNRMLYNPQAPPRNHQNFEDYATDQGHTINHFYEKLLLLKDRMQTETGKEIAKNRHRFMETFLQQFYAEWNGKK